MSKKKVKTALEKHLIAQANSTVEVPFDVWRMFGNETGRSIELLGEQISLGEDYGSLEECRNAIAWYVEQLGGTVEWK